VTHHLVGSTRRHDDRHAARHCFEHDQAEGLRERGEYENVGRAIHLRQLGLGNVCRMAIQITKRKINFGARNKIADEVQFRVDLAEAAIRLQQVTDTLALADIANEEHAERRWPTAGCGGGEKR
jgi:hypothetical protein